MRLITCVFAAAVLAASAAPLWAQQPPPAEGSEAELIAVLQSDAPLFDKAKACQQLAVTGSKESVPVLADMLSDPKLAHYARYALEPIPDPAVDEALRGALGELDGLLLIGVINSVGVRGDREAVEALEGLLAGADADAATAAAAALGRIATPDAIATLTAALSRPEPVQSAAAGACLRAADTMRAEGKAAEAAALYASLRAADLREHFQVAALAGVIRTRGKEALPLLAECLQSDDRAAFRVGLHMAHELGGAEVARVVMEKIELPETVEAPKEGTVVEKAEYGAGDRWVDVTAAVIAAAEQGQAVVASNDLAGDPAPKTPKVLRVVYTKDGERRTAEVPEGEQFTLEGVAAATPHPRQVLLINALGTLGEKAALPVVLEAARSDATDIRRAAVSVLGQLGDASAVPVLLDAAVNAPVAAEAARQSLIELEGDGVDAALARELADAEGQKRILLIELAGDRGISTVVPVLKEAAGDDDPQVAKAAIGALGATVGLDDLPALLELLVQDESPEMAAAAKDALRMAVLRMPDRDAAAARLLAAAPRASTSAQIDLIDLLGVVGGDRALAGVGAAAKSGSDELQDAATRVLGEWMSPDVAPVLLDLARSGPEKYRVRCLRGYIRVFRQLGLPDEEKLAMAGKAFEAAARDEERRLVLDAVTRVPEPEALEMAMRQVGNPALKQAACEAAVAVAEQIVGEHPAAVADAMTKVMAAGPDADTTAKARRWLNEAKKRTGGN